MTKISFLRKRMHDAYQSNNLDQAASLGEVLIKEHTAQPTSPGLSNDLYNLALVYDELDRLDKAAALYTESIYYAPASDYEALAVRSMNLGGVLARMGGLEIAHHFYIQARHISKHYLGEHHQVYADALYNLANLVAQTNNTSTAQALHEEALAIREKSGNSADILNSLHSLAFIHEENGDYKKAASYGEAALAQATGTDYARACKYLAELYETTSQHKKALDMYTLVLDKISIIGCTTDDYMAILHRKENLATDANDTQLQANANALKGASQAINPQKLSANTKFTVKQNRHPLQL